MRPRFSFGDEVRVVRSIRNDGTVAGRQRGDLLVRRGSVGYVREWGVFLQDQLIYQIHFLDGDQIIGCREQELIPAAQSWAAGQFQYGDTILLTRALAIGGNVVVTPGQQGRIQATGQGVKGDDYTVRVGDRWFLVPAIALHLLEENP
nr:nitrogen fixation protein NifZ [uncultured Enterobacter sp.]